MDNKMDIIIFSTGVFGTKISLWVVNVALRYSVVLQSCFSKAIIRIFPIQKILLVIC